MKGQLHNIYKIGKLKNTMVKGETVLSRYEIQRLVKYHGTVQSSEDAEIFAIKRLEDMGEEIIKLALEVAKANKRSTISAKDIDLVLKK